MQNRQAAVGTLVAGQHFWYTYAAEVRRREFIKTTDLVGCGLPALPIGITLAVDLSNGDTAALSDVEMVTV